MYHYAEACASACRPLCCLTAESGETEIQTKWSRIEQIADTGIQEFYKGTLTTGLQVAVTDDKNGLLVRTHEQHLPQYKGCKTESSERGNEIETGGGGGGRQGREREREREESRDNGKDRIERRQEVRQDAQSGGAGEGEVRSTNMLQRR